ncbi:MAG: hypothetical protein HOP09_03545 [Hyphomicrobium sp.]|nr:hypothetical protein [Hyphomicrobium sp.]
MGIFKSFRTWRVGRDVAFIEDPASVSIEARLGAAEYEFRSIARDVAAVMLDGPPRVMTRPATR